MYLELPKELYIHIFILGDDIEITKTLRSLCKLSYDASYDYFKIITKKSIIVNFDSGELFINNKPNVIDLTSYYGDIVKPISFNITISNLYNSFIEIGTKNKK